VALFFGFIIFKHKQIYNIDLNCSRSFNQRLEYCQKYQVKYPITMTC